MNADDDAAARCYQKNQQSGGVLLRCHDSLLACWSIDEMEMIA